MLISGLFTGIIIKIKHVGERLPFEGWFKRGGCIVANGVRGTSARYAQGVAGAGLKTLLAVNVNSCLKAESGVYFSSSPYGMQSHVCF